MCPCQHIILTSVRPIFLLAHALSPTKRNVKEQEEEIEEKIEAGEDE